MTTEKLGLAGLKLFAISKLAMMGDYVHIWYAWLPSESDHTAALASLMEGTNSKEKNGAIHLIINFDRSG